MDGKEIMLLIRGALEDFDGTFLTERGKPTEILTGDIHSSVADSAVMTIKVDGKEYEITVRGDD